MSVRRRLELVLGRARGEGAARAPALRRGTVITLRLVERSDADGAIERLAALSGMGAPTDASLLAEVDGQPRAALSLRGELLSDPFHPSDELGSLLALRLTQLGSEAASPDAA